MKEVNLHTRLVMGDTADCESNLEKLLDDMSGWNSLLIQVYCNPMPTQRLGIFVITHQSL